MAYSILLIMYQTYQPWILDCIKILSATNPYPIYVGTHEKYFKYFSGVQLIDIDQFGPLELKVKLKFDDFFNACSLRFWYIREIMNRYCMDSVFHIENDVCIFYDFDKLTVDQEHIYITMETRNEHYLRSPPAIVYIPKVNLLDQILMSWNYNFNDMYQFSTAKQLKPIKTTDEINIIIDPAAIGQYLYGIDTRPYGSDMKSEQTIGFKNEVGWQCCELNNVKIERVAYDQEYISKHLTLFRPIIISKNGTWYIPFNIHMHNKNLKFFIT